MTDEAQGHALARLQTRAAYFLGDDDFKAIVQQLKNRAIRKWADGKDTGAREGAWYDLQAVGRLEIYLQELAGGKVLADRKDDHRERVRRR